MSAGTGLESSRGRAAAAPAFAVSPPGTWTEPVISLELYADALARVRSAAGAAPGPVRALLEQALAAGEARWRGLSERPAGAAIACGLRSFRPGGEALASFLSWCAAAVAGGAPPGFEYKARREPFGGYAAGLCVEGAFSVVARFKDGELAAALFAPLRDSFFLPGFCDDLPKLRVSSSLWVQSNCMDRVALASARVSGVHAFVFGGRHYVTAGAGTAGVAGRREALAWSLVLRDCWRGPVHCYSDLVAAWADGRLEYGDHRGLVVRVDGRLCVLARAAWLVDEGAAQAAGAMASERAQTACV